MGAKAKRARSKTYGLAEAKAKLSEIVTRSQREGAQAITYRGRPAAYVVSAEDWEKRKRSRGTLADFFRNSAAYKLGLEFDRESGQFLGPKP